MKHLLKVSFVLALLFIPAFLFAQAGNCGACHDDSTLIIGMRAAWSESAHGMGESYVRGTRSSCAACHSGGAFSASVASGYAPDEADKGDPYPTRQSCRACHQIHTKYTTADWALETTSRVPLYAFDNVTFNGGKGNLCVNCHQPRRQIADPEGGKIKVTSTHWGPHHGPQSAMLLGIGGAGVRGSAGVHSTVVRDSCVTCHLGSDNNHTFEAVLSSCTTCHADAEDFDIDGVQTEIQGLIDQVAARLEAKGLYHDGHPVVGEYPAAQAQALWNYIFVVVEAASLGVHNYQYTKSMLQAALRALR
jgi:hypothetical protein